VSSLGAQGGIPSPTLKEGLRAADTGCTRAAEAAMTAVACAYAEIDGVQGPLSEALVSELDEEHLTLLLLSRFRRFLETGDDPYAALLRAVGYSQTTAATIAFSLEETPALLH
jgi:hypothetical protein